MKQPHELSKIMPPMGGEDYKALVASIRERGLIHPILLFEGKVLDGNNRLRACADAKVEPRFDEFKGDDPLQAVIDLNVARRHLNESQRAMVAGRIATAKHGGDRKSANQKNNCSLDEAAKRLNVSTRPVKEAKAVQASAAKEVVAAVESGQVRVSDAANLIKATDGDKEAQAQAVQDVKDGKAKTATAAANKRRNANLSEATMPKLPKGKHRVVVLDPPWPIEFGHDRSNALLQGAGTPYPAMSLDEIAALPVGDLLADDAWAFLWTIQQFLPDSFALIEKWGVQHQFTMVWHKPKGPQTAGRPCSNGEFVLVGKRGKPKFTTTKGFRMVFDAPVPKGHSTKPEEFYALLRRVTQGPRLDMFSRRDIDGFSAWGKEAK